MAPLRNRESNAGCTMYDSSPRGAMFLLIGQLDHAVFKVSFVNHQLR
jgi:hypothetical protein